MNPREFISKGYGKAQLEKAVRQQEQLQYFAVSDIQENIKSDYLDKISESYTGTDPMLGWVWSLFRKDNFKSFYKYLRFPVSSSRLTKDEIEKSLERVFFADDSFKKYVVNGKEVQEPEYLYADEFAKETFHNLLYNHNDIIIHDIKEVNIPYRYRICIDKVSSIIADKKEIKKIAYKTTFEIKEQDVDGYIYLDDKIFAFIPSNQAISSIEVPHDLGKCPASFVSSTAFKDSEPIVKESIFSRVRPLLEEYVFMTTLRLMSDANGAFPIVVKLASEAVDEGNNQQKEYDNDAMSSGGFEGHKKKKPESELNAGSVTELPVHIKQDGSIDTDLVKNYITFFRTPVESLKYIDDRIHAIRKQVIETVVGDFAEQNEAQKNEMQVSKSYIAKQDRLRALGYDIAWSIKTSDSIMLGLANGSNVYVNVSSGTDFFIETQSDLLALYAASPNPIEKLHILERLVRIRGGNNVDRLERDVILYKLVPFVNNSDFERSLGLNIVSKEDIYLQTKFSYFISIFESQYGDIVELWESMDDLKEDSKLIFIKNLLTLIIKDYESKNSILKNDPIPER